MLHITIPCLCYMISILYGVIMLGEDGAAGKGREGGRGFFYFISLKKKIEKSKMVCIM